MTQQFSLKEMQCLSTHRERAEYICRLKQQLEKQREYLVQSNADKEVLYKFNNEAESTLYTFLSDFAKLKLKLPILYSVELVEAFDVLKEAGIKESYLHMLFLDDSCTLIQGVINLIVNDDTSFQTRLQAISIFESFHKEYTFNKAFDEEFYLYSRSSLNHNQTSLLVSMLLGKREIEFNVDVKRLTIQEEAAIAKKFCSFFSFNLFAQVLEASVVLKNNYPVPKNDIKNYFGCLFQLAILNDCEFIQYALRTVADETIIDFLFNAQAILDDELQPYTIYKNQPNCPCFTSESLEVLSSKIYPALRGHNTQKAKALIDSTFAFLLKIPPLETLSLSSSIFNDWRELKHFSNAFCDKLFTLIEEDIENPSNTQIDSYATLEGKCFTYFASLNSIYHYDNLKLPFNSFERTFADKVFLLIMNKLNTHSYDLLMEIKSGVYFTEEEITLRGEVFKQQIKLIEDILKSNPVWQVAIERFDKLNEAILCAVKEKRMA